MPIRKFRSVEEMEGNVWYEPGSPELFRAIRTKAAAAPGKDIVVRVHPDLAAHLEGDRRDDVDRLAGMIGARVSVESVRQPRAREDYELIVR